MAEIPQEIRKYTPENRERCRRAITAALEGALRADKKLIGVEKVMDAGARDRNATTTMLRLWRAGELSVADVWDAPKVDAPSLPADVPRLGALVRAAKSDGDREELLHELAALVADGKVAPDEAAQIRAALAEARQAADAKRSNEPAPEDPHKLLLASPEAMLAARALDWFVDDGRRDRVLAFIAAELEADRAQHPNEDEGGK